MKLLVGNTYEITYYLRNATGEKYIKTTNHVQITDEDNDSYYVSTHCIRDTPIRKEDIIYD